MNDGPTDRTEADVIEHLAMTWVDMVGPVHLSRTTACLGSVAHQEWARGYNLLDSEQRYKLECRVVEILNGLERAKHAIDGAYSEVERTQEDREA